MTLTAPDPEPEPTRTPNPHSPLQSWNDPQLSEALDGISAQERIQAELAALEVEMEDACHYRDTARQLALLDYLGRLNRSWERGEDPLKF